MSILCWEKEDFMDLDWNSLAKKKQQKMEIGLIFEQGCH